MQSRFTRALIVFGMVVLTVAPQRAAAQAGSFGIGTGGGAGVPVGRFGDLFQPGPAYSLFASIGLLENLEADVLFTQAAFIDRDPEPAFIFGDYNNVTVTTLTVGPRVFLLDSSRVFRPSIAGGLGYARVEANDSGENPFPDDDRFAFDLGGGFDLGRPSWAFRFEARYSRSVASGGGEDLGHVMPLVSFTYRFLAQHVSSGVGNSRRT